MADSVTHEEFLKKQNKQQEMSPTDTETTMEDMQQTIIQVATHTPWYKEQK